MEHGTNCYLASCRKISFLPIKCPACNHVFCEPHAFPLEHQCQATSTSSTTPPKSTAATSHRIPCQKKGCKGFSLAVMPSRQATTNPGEQIFTHNAPTCKSCKGLFCTSHITPFSHDCQAKLPLTQGQEKMKAAEQRKTKASSILSRFFPSKAA